MAFSDWSTTAASNITVGSVDIDEGCAPSGINNAIRAVMAEAKAGVPGLAIANTFTAVQSFASGTAGAPSISFSADADTGIYRASANTLGLAVAGVQGASLTQTAFTLNADSALVVSGTGAATTRTNLGLVIGTDVQAYDADLAAIAALAKTDGNIIVGDGSAWVAESGATARASLGLIIGTDVQAYDVDTAKTDVSSTWTAGQTMAANLVVNSGNEVRLNTFSATGATTGLNIASGSVVSSNASTTTQNHYRFYNPNGQVGSIQTSGSGTSFNTTSDERLKEDFSALYAGSIIDQISVYQYQWKADGAVGYGPKAQELYEVFPQAVTVGSAGDAPGDDTFIPWGYDASALVPLLLAEVKALRERVSAVEAR